MSNVMTVSAVSAAMAMSVVIAVGVEVALIAGFLKLMIRAAAQLEQDAVPSRKSAAR